MSLGTTPSQREAAIRRAMRAAQTQLFALDDEAGAALIRLYEWAAQSIASEIAQRADELGNIGLAQLSDLLRQVEARLAQVAAGRDSALTDSLGQASRLGAGTFVEAGVISPASMRAPDEAVRFVLSFVGQDGLQLSDRLWRIDRGARDAVVNAIERSVIMGHGAAQAAAEFLTRGQPVPADVRDKLRAANAPAIAKETSAILAGEKTPGGAMAQAMRVFRTEINRAHGIAYMAQAEQAPGFRGIRFTLSPQHPKPDVCDELAKNDTFGLGEGVYPNMAEFVKVWPAHPNTFSFPVAVFA